MSVRNNSISFLSHSLDYPAGGSFINASVCHSGWEEFLDCINYLAMAKYIQLRTIADKILVPDFADIGWDLLEAKLTAEGISVLCHKTKDEMIEV